MLRPAAEWVSLAWVIAAYAALLGFYEIMLGLELRTAGKAA
jgi:hypothetical protein